MTSLEPKQVITTKKQTNKGWLIFVAAFLLVLLILGFVLLCLFADPHTKERGCFPESSFSADDISGGSEILQNTQNNNIFSPDNALDDISHQTAQGDSSDGNDSSNGQTGSTPSSSLPSVSSSTPSSPSSDTSGDNSSGQQSGSESSETEISPPPSTVTYTYREAKQGDDFYVHYAFPDNAIVITGVSAASDDGLYIIPEKIDGKPVVAIMANAFYSVRDTVKKVVIPSTVKTVWNYAFAGCRNMTDIYFCGKSIYVEAQAFEEASSRAGTLTIHCSADCSNRNLYYYKNIAQNYDATYKEWNGGEYN